MAVNWGGAGTGALSGASMGTMINPGIGTAIGAGLGGLLGLFSGGGSGDGETNIQDLMDEIINKYSYKPQYTGQTEASLFDLFQRMTGQGKYIGSGNGDVNAIPFDIGLPTTGLYDSLTRGIKQDYLGTPGAGEGGKLADLRAYYNNLGIPEQAINAERLGYQDMNNSLLDKAALINESQKDRLSGLLSTGVSAGGNLYAQNLNQQRFNAGLGAQALNMDYGLSDAISQANQTNLNSLLGIGGSSVGSYGSYSNPATGNSGATSLLSNLFGGQTQKNSPYLTKTSAGSSTAKLISGSK
jgi:hypothetical protein